LLFPIFALYRTCHPGPYERGMGEAIVRLLQLFKDHVPDQESNALVLKLATNSSKWTAGHAVFDKVRDRLLDTDDQNRTAQYNFEESCCKAIYNASDPSDPFDPSSAFFVVPEALSLANVLGIPVEAVMDALCQPTEDA